MSSDDCDFGNLSESDNDYGSLKKDEIADEEFDEPIKKPVKSKTAPDPKSAKPTKKTTKASAKATPEPNLIKRQVGSLGPKLALPPPRRVGLSRNMK